MSLLEEALLLQRAAHDLMYLGMDGSPIYSDDLSRRNSEVYRLTTTLYNSGTWGTTVEEQANVCLALLKGYSASFIDHLHACQRAFHDPSGQRRGMRESR